MNRNVYFPPSIFEAIKEHQKTTGETFNKIVSLALTDYLKLNDSAPSTIESKPVNEVKQTKQPKKKETPIERPLSRSELFRSISKNRA